MHVGQLRAQPLGDRLLVAPVEVGEQQAYGDRLGTRVADRADDPVRLALGQRVDLAPRPIRPRAPMRRSRGTSATGFGAHRR